MKFKFLMFALLGVSLHGLTNKIKPDSKAELDKALAQHKDKDKIVEFFATWCGFCTMFDPMLEEVAKENPEVTIIQLDVDKHGDVQNQFGVQGMPTSFLFKGGEPVDHAHRFRYKVQDTNGKEVEKDSVVGADKDGLKEAVAVLKGDKKPEDITVQAAPEMPANPEEHAQPEQPSALGGVHAAVQGMLGEDLSKELGDKLPPAFDKFLESDKLSKIVDKAADLVAEVIKEVLGHVDLDDKIKAKLADKLAEAKKNSEASFKQMEPMLKQMNPKGHKMAKLTQESVGKVIDKTRAVVTGKKAPAKKNGNKNGHGKSKKMVKSPSLA